MRPGLRPTRATKGLPCPRWRGPSLYPNTVKKYLKRLDAAG